MGKAICTILLLFSFNINAQIINTYISECNLDSLILTVREMSGEDSTIVNGTKVLIRHRRSPWGNDIAADYLKQRLEKFNLSVTEQNYSTSGRNIMATQTGSVNPDSIIIVCAHYDSANEYAADDNASGCAAVLEAVRILSAECFKYTVIYAFWDEEEWGFQGSENYAAEMEANGIPIVGVINVDMMAYDSSNDNLFDIYVDSIQNSFAIKDSLIEVVNDFNLQLVPYMHPTPVTSSDHASFWLNNYSAIGFGEAYYGGDYNPTYHTIDDRIDMFNMPYFHELSKLLVGVSAKLAIPCTNNINIKKSISFTTNIFPNPTTGLIIIQAEGVEQVEVFNINGQVVYKSEVGGLKHKVDLGSEPKGIYIIKVQTDKGVAVEKVILD